MQKKYMTYSILYYHYCVWVFVYVFDLSQETQPAPRPFGVFSIEVTRPKAAKSALPLLYTA